MAKVNASLDHAGRDSSPGSKRVSTQQKSLRGLAMIGVLGILLIAAGPFLFGSYLLNVLIQAFFFSIVAVTVDILWGYTGYLTDRSCSARIC